MAAQQGPDQNVQRHEIDILFRWVFDMSLESGVHLSTSREWRMSPEKERPLNATMPDQAQADHKDGEFNIER
jgi:hypothetical protein